MATISKSCASKAERKNKRPILPKPLIANRAFFITLIITNNRRTKSRRMALAATKLKN
jgi:hypothetical protein